MTNSPRLSGRRLPRRFTGGLQKDLERLKYRNLIILPLLAGVLAFAPYLMNQKTASQGRDYPPQIFVNDSVYRGTGHTVSVIPEEAVCLSSIAEAVPQHKPMVHENFYSNTLPALRRIEKGRLPAAFSLCREIRPDSRLFRSRSTVSDIFSVSLKNF